MLDTHALPEATDPADIEHVADLVMLLRMLVMRYENDLMRSIDENTATPDSIKKAYILIKDYTTAIDVITTLVDHPDWTPEAATENQ